MSNPHTALGRAIYSLLSGGTVAVYDSIAVQGGTPPYAIFQLQAGSDAYTFNSTEFSGDYVVKVLSNRIWPGEAEQVYSHLHTLMQNGALSIPGYRLLRSRRTGLVKYREQSYWHVGGVYRIDAQQK